MHTRVPQPQDMELLALANRRDGRVVLTPISFNGQQRLALAYAGATADGGVSLRVLGVILDGTDAVLDAHGRPLLYEPPTAKSAMN
jgi:hypothetical protein